MNTSSALAILGLSFIHYAQAQTLGDLRLDCAPQAPNTGIEKVELRQLTGETADGKVVLSRKNSSLTIQEAGKDSQKLPIRFAIDDLNTVLASSDETPKFENGSYVNSTILKRLGGSEERATLIRGNQTVELNCQNVTTKSAATPTPAPAVPVPVAVDVGQYAVSNPGVIETLNSSNYNSKVSQGTVVVEFKANWCGYCRVYRNTIQDFAASNTQVKVYVIDVDQQPELQQRMGVSSLPTTLIYKNGRLQYRDVGVLSYSDLVSGTR